MATKAYPTKALHPDNLVGEFHDFMKIAGTAAVCVGMALNPAKTTSNFQKMDSAALSQNSFDPDAIKWVMGAKATGTMAPVQTALHVPASDMHGGNHNFTGLNA